jgi:hypothetical protein
VKCSGNMKRSTPIDPTHGSLGQSVTTCMPLDFEHKGQTYPTVRHILSDVDVETGLRMLECGEQQRFKECK